MSQEVDWSSKFERFEDKLDKIGEALAALARLDEKLIQQQDSLSRGYERMSRIESDLREQKASINAVGEMVRINDKAVGGIKRAIWMLATTCMTALFAVAINNLDKL